VLVGCVLRTNKKRLVVRKTHPTINAMNMEYQIISQVCKALTEEKIEVANSIIEMVYPHRPLMSYRRNYSEYQSTKIFIRDGFIDRYSGKRMIFPPILRLLSNLMPEKFPFQKNWKMTECHIAYWQLFPTIDHIVPVARGGKDNDENWVTTSMLRNSAKSNWLIEELDWNLYPPGKLKEWDGLIHWFLEYVKNHPDSLNIKYIYKWYKALIHTIET
jgi:5-methylcytosine-specific restriction endonuclease McrA